MELYQYTIHELADKLAQKEVSAVEITKSVLKRQDKVENKIKAYITRTDDVALAQAQKVDQDFGQNKLAPLAGIAGAVQDSICTKGVKTTAGSKTLAGFVSPYDAFVMEKLAQNSLVLTGKTNMDEFGIGNTTRLSAFSPTANPWDTARVSGSGAAAAVAAGEAIWAIGSDTTGAIRQSAAFCGLVGLKPTYGLVSRYGLISYASSLDQIGPITRDVTDCALVLNAIAGFDSQDTVSARGSVPDYTKALQNDVRGLKIGIPKEYFTAEMDEDIRKSLLQAIADFKSLGASCVEISLPHTKYAAAAACVISSGESSSTLARFDGIGFGHRSSALGPDDNIHALYAKSRGESLGGEAICRIILGTCALSAGHYEDYYLKAMKVRTLIKNDFERAWENVDLLISPVTARPAGLLSEKTGGRADCAEDIYTVLANLAGLPAISLPCGFTGTNLPVGLQLIGKPLAEPTLLQAAYTFEQNHDYHTQTAPLEGGAL